MGFFQTASCSLRSKVVLVFKDLRAMVNIRKGVEIRMHALSETDEISHGTDSEISHEVHAPGMHCVDEVLPILDGAVVRIERREVNRRVTLSRMMS